jgi:hypothetical protein
MPKSKLIGRIATALLLMTAVPLVAAAQDAVPATESAAAALARAAAASSGVERRAPLGC